jgi:hypothetical protein
MKQYNTEKPNRLKKKLRMDAKQGLDKAYVMVKDMNKNTTHYMTKEAARVRVLGYRLVRGIRMSYKHRWSLVA